jgi:hypothetical protein
LIVRRPGRFGIFRRPGRFEMFRRLGKYGIFRRLGMFRRFERFRIIVISYLYKSRRTNSRINLYF